LLCKLPDILSVYAAYGFEGPPLQPAYQQAAQSQQHNAHTWPTAAKPLTDNYHETLALVSSTIRHDVDQFLVALPLGTGPDDAAVEEAVASKLYEALLSKAVMQHKLTEWYGFAGSWFTLSHLVTMERMHVLQQVCSSKVLRRAGYPQQYVREHACSVV